MFSEANVFSFTYVNIHAVYQSMEDEINGQFSRVRNTNLDLLTQRC